MSGEAEFRIYICGGVHCSAAGSSRLVRALEDQLWARGADGRVEVRVSGCQSRCDDAPNATVWPGPQHFAHLSDETLRHMLDALLR
jgi:NADH:ubiquinone oxidoreductase subunit E